MARIPNYDELGQRQFLEEISHYYKTGVVTGKQITEFCQKFNKPQPHFLINDKGRNVKWGHYRVANKNFGDNVVSAAANLVHTAPSSLVDQDVNVIPDSLVPDIDPTFVPFGFYPDLVKVLDRGIFYPIMFTGDTGCGKTTQIIQACARQKREMLRVNVTKMTDELDLIGSHELINGSTLYREGPVTIAMKRGAILLLDEIDYGSEQLLCLQPILEGKPYFNKKTKEVIKPAPGFNIMVTCNTKGKGSSDGRWVGANVLNEAFLDRLCITVECDYPSRQTELSILKKNFEVLGCDNDETEEFSAYLVSWADQTRKTYKDGGIDAYISTRRLVSIAGAYSIWGTKLKSISLCLNRFEEDSKVSLMDLYKKVDPNPEGKAKKESKGPAKSSSVKFMALAAELTRRYKTQVVLTETMEDNTLSIESHGSLAIVDLKEYPHNSAKLKERVRAIIELNEANNR